MVSLDSRGQRGRGLDMVISEDRNRSCGSGSHNGSVVAGSVPWFPGSLALA